jgi:hypothetical protein
MLANNPVNLTDPSGLIPNIPTNSFGNGGSWSPPQPGVSQYDQTNWAGGIQGAINAANQLTRQLSQGARPLGSRSPECGPTGVLGDWWQSLQRGTLGPDLLRWGLNEYRTNPLWQRQFTDAELRQLTIDLANRGEFGITRLLHQIVDEKGLQHWLTGQVDYAVQALRSMRDDPRQLAVLAFNLGTGLIATGLGPAGLLAMPAILAANVAFQTWVESGGGFNFNWAAFRSSFQINVAATGAGMAGGMIGQMIGGPVGRLIGSALGGGLGQIVTNAIQGRPWDEGLLFNMGLSVGMEGVMAGVEHWASGGLRGSIKRTGELENVSEPNTYDRPDVQLLSKAQADTGDTTLASSNWEPASLETPSQDYEFTQQVLDILNSTKAGQELLAQLPSGGEMPSIEYTNEMKALRQYGEYDATKNAVFLDKGFLREDPRLAVASLAHELAHRNPRRWWTNSVLEEYRSFRWQQRVWQEVIAEGGKIDVKTDFGYKILVRQSELTQAVKQSSLWAYTRRIYPDLPVVGQNLWNYSYPNDPEFGRRYRDRIRSYGP